MIGKRTLHFGLAHAVFLVVAMRVVTAYAQVLPIAADSTVR
jgi:hypothetical protein